MQMISTDLNVPPEKLVLKKSEKQGWFQALDVASSWLDRMDRGPVKGFDEDALSGTAGRFAFCDKKSTRNRAAFAWFDKSGFYT